MLVLKIDKSARTKEDLAEYLRLTASHIEDGAKQGLDWDVEGNAEPETFNEDGTDEPDDFSGAGDDEER